jgi:nitrite reductase/ring-hydroxylating ferredoxin subunit
LLSQSSVVRSIRSRPKRWHTRRNSQSTPNARLDSPHIRSLGVIYRFVTIVTGKMHSPFTTAAALILTSLWSTTRYYGEAYSVPFFATRRSALTMKRGRGSLGREVGGRPSPANNSNNSNGPSLGSSLNWCPIPAGQTLPTTEGKVGFLDTNLPTMKNGNTNPTGAVAAVRYDDNIYCFASACPSCQVPLSKAKILPANEETKQRAPRLTCDFCKATYSLGDGSKLQTTESGGILGGVVKSIFASQSSGPLKLYKLGEQKGKLLIVVD